MIGSKIQVQADRIDLVVEGEGEDAEVNAASIALAINNGGSEAAITADQIYLNGATIVKNGTDLIASGGWFTDLYSGSGGGQFVVEGTDIRAYSKINAEGGVDALDGATVQATNLKGTNLEVGGSSATWQSMSVVTEVGRTAAYTFKDTGGTNRTIRGIGTVTKTTISYLGGSAS